MKTASVKLAAHDRRDVQRWAEKMVRLCARACVITQLTGLPSSEVRALWQRIAGRSSPSGQQPNDLGWYLKTANRRYHSALIVQLFSRAKSTMPDFAALTHAYYHYARLTASLDRPNGSLWTPITGEDPAYRPNERDYEIPFSRAHYLCQSYTDEKLVNGRRMCELQIRRCAKCGGLYMSSDTEAGRYCPLCEH